MERNTMVSVFLPRLEYFQGVLIMTTNRQRTIDSAFDSRIHFNLHYGDMSTDSRFKIWKNRLGNVPKELSVAKIKDQDLEQLAKLRLNGRQIKNAMACAISIAVEDKVPLAVTSIETMLSMMVEQDSGAG
jgi:SpoVK/Ycf46/Vps4 family AAA+-type ATPase